MHGLDRELVANIMRAAFALLVAYAIQVLAYHKSFDEKSIGL